jgi:deoxyribodipyrimidine photo-lyase
MEASADRCQAAPLLLARAFERHAPTMPAMRIIHWFRRDLRLVDNTSLAAAARDSGGDVVPAFVLDDRLLRGVDVAPARVQFLLDSLRDLDAGLRRAGSRLRVRRGDPRTELAALAREAGASAVYFNRDYTPLARQRDEQVAAALRAAGCLVESFKDAVNFEAGEILTADGRPYLVFTPYKRAWLAALERKGFGIGDWRFEMGDSSWGTTGQSKISRLESPIPNLQLLAPADFGIPADQAVPPGGATQAERLLADFAASGRLAGYADHRDMLAEDGTSRLSPHLRFGTISPRACARAALDPSAGRGGQAWLNELIWREFYAQILFHFPRADHGNLRPAYDRLRWGSGDAGLDQERFAAWCQGRTGYPIVDAGMRQLAQTAWMHNRARMITASFLVKDLLLDWRWGESWFMRRLVDGDPASNNGGWQWAAGTGTDAQPYFRVFNPVLQGRRFDPDGRYVRRHVPELAGVPAAFIHEPWRMPEDEQRRAGCRIGREYPAPIVDHAVQKAETIRRFKEV